jgi:pyridoxal phosphate enzyme (YggS family)
MAHESITSKVQETIAELPDTVTLVAAGKTRTPAQLQAAIAGGVSIIGHNYIQEAEASIDVMGHAVRWHFIGHLQRNKAKKAAALFDMVETVDSLRLGKALDRACQALGKKLPVLIEVNSGQEDNKAGCLPERVPALARELAALEHLSLEGLMTMGPWLDDPEDMRPYFRLTHELFDDLAAASIPGARMRHLSMGMSDSYRVAIEEGASLVRIGTALFGSR